ncbi:MAG: hypothetical protein V4553_00875 [Bacteroidota bacterium]
MPSIAKALFLSVMKYQEGQQVILLTLDGKPAAGKAVVERVDAENGYYTVRHYLREDSHPDLISNVVEGRLVVFAGFI